MNRAVRHLVLLLMGGAFFLSAPPVMAAEEFKSARLRVLDKVTGRIVEDAIDVGESKRFGNLEITLRYCRASPPEDRPEIVAFLEILHYEASSESFVKIFSGWMFASSPALNALEHPVYSVWPISCSTRPGGGFSSSAKKRHLFSLARLR